MAAAALTSLPPPARAHPAVGRFFFAVSNTRAGQSYRFNLVNLLKGDSLYNAGMLPLVHSERRMAQEVNSGGPVSCPDPCASAGP